MQTIINNELIHDLEKITDAGQLIGEIFSRFGKRAAIGTSGQLTGVVMIDLAHNAKVNPRVFTLDTLRLFPESYKLFDEIEKKYKIQIERTQPDGEDLKKMISENGEYLFFDSKEKQELCCNIRKVRPNNKILKTVDVWLTGLRSDQSARRAKTPQFQIIHHPEDHHPILKVSPLLKWTEEQLRNYIKKNKVPMHPLLNWNENGWTYESLGCILCTTPISPTEPRRAGRWRWFNALDPNSKECGLHVEEPKDSTEMDS